MIPLAVWGPKTSPSPPRVTCSPKRGATRATSLTWVPGYCPPPDPSVLEAVVRVVHDEEKPAWRDHGRARHGARNAATPEGIAPFYTRIRRGSPPSPEQLVELTRRYSALGGTSPLSERTAAQVAGLAAALERDAPGAYDVRYGSKFEPPLLEEAAASFQRDGLTKVVGLVLAPHGLLTFHGPVHEPRARSIRRRPNSSKSTSGTTRPDFLQLIADRVKVALSTIDASRLDTTEVIFSAHLPSRRALQGRRHLPRTTTRECRGRGRACGTVSLFCCLAVRGQNQ